MSKTVINSPRIFQVWKYTAGHKQLLLRSTKSKDCATRINVFFKGAEQFHLPTTFAGLFIGEASDAEVGELSILPKPPLSYKERRTFAVKGVEFTGYVVALSVAVHEDEGEYYDPSFFAKKHII